MKKALSRAREIVHTSTLDTGGLCHVDACGVARGHQGVREGLMK